MKWAHLLSPDIKVVSFDIFDTVVTRDIYRPQGIFERVQARLDSEGRLDANRSVLSGLAGQRLHAEQEARQELRIAGAISHGDIMDLLRRRAGLTSAMAQDVSACEYEEEIASAKPVESVISLIRLVRDAGKKVVFISDMYLPDDVLRKVLIRVGAMAADDRLYVSGTIGSKKSSGLLFRHVMDDLGINPSEMVHLGDYLWSDVLVPRWKYGIRSLPVRIARANIYERLWGEPCGCLYCSSVAGASRAARVLWSGECRPAAEASLYRLGCNVLGPILAAFLLWTLHRAAQDGIRRLYFLSRDGEVMLEEARQLAERLGVGIELRYLYVSRTAVFPALLGTGLDVRTIGWLKEDTIVLTLRILADRLKVEASSLLNGLLRAGTIIKGPDDPLERVVVEKICGLLVTDHNLRIMLAESGRTAQQNLADYLEQEKLFDGTPSAVVDLGWHGGIQDVIFSCFKERLGKQGISGYYFGVDLPGEPANRKTGYFFDHREGTRIHRYRHFFRVLIELLCSGSHGMVRYYLHDVEGTCHPFCGEVEHPENQERVVTIRQGTRAFFKSLDISSVKGADYEHVRPQILSVFKRLFFFPSPNEARALGGMSFSADQAGHGLHLVAPPLDTVSAVRFLAKRSYAARSSISSWFFASLALSGTGVRLALYPILLVLRVCYCGSDLPMFGKMMVADFLNNTFSLVKISRAGNDRGNQ